MHCMLDLETLSTLHNARIVSIGAVLFDKDGIHHQFYQAVQTPPLSRVLEIKSVFDVSAETVKWWEQQSTAARTVFSDPNALHIADALFMFQQWINENADPDDVKIWGNGASFDNAILSTAYNLMGIWRPWKFWNDRCYRTVKEQFPQVSVKRIGVAHNALDDAKTQTEHLLRVGVAL